MLQKQDYEEHINILDDKIKKEKLDISSLENKITNYSSLEGLLELLIKSQSQEEINRILTESIYNIFGDKRITCILYLWESQNRELVIVSTKKYKDSQIIKSKKGDIFDDWVLKKLQPLLIEDTKTDFRFDLEKVNLQETRPIRSLISSPLTLDKKVLGLLRIDSIDMRFSFDDLRLLTTIGDLASIAIENALLYERAEELAIKDELTALYLRRYFFERLQEELQRSLLSKTPLSIIMLDIDNFKHYNDKYGHIAGDIVLRQLSGILKETFCKAGNLICRYGGEEFAIFLSNCDKNLAKIQADSLRNKIKEKKIFLRRRPTQISVSMGLASLPEDARVMEDLLRKADLALYKAKQQGKDRVCTF